MKKLKLNQLAKKELAKKEMYNIRGGACTGGHNGCGCGCIYAGLPGGYSSLQNDSANRAKGLSTHGV